MTLDYVKALTQQIVASLPQRLDPATISLTAKLPFRAMSLREALIHRVADLSEAAVRLYESGQTLPAFVITRALMETAASLYRR